MSNNNNSSSYSNSLWKLAGAATAATVSAGLYYYLTNNSNSSRQHSPLALNSNEETERNSPVSKIANYLGNLTLRTSNTPTDMIYRRDVPRNPVINNLNGLLSDIYVRYIEIKRDDFEHHYKVFMKVFDKLHVYMQESDPYYNRYHSRILHSGSHYDKSRVKKPDEFDMDIEIGLPLNIHANQDNSRASDIILEAKSPGYVQLKMGQQFKNLPYREDWHINKAAFNWKDDKDYLLRSKFIDWFKGVVNRALKKFDITHNGYPYLDVDGVRYSINTSESGPAMTLKIINVSTSFQLDVDLVPSLKFPEDRWPVCRGYKNIPLGCNKGWWLVVPKPNKDALDSVDVMRSWRIAMTDQEKQYMNNLYNLRQGYRLLKKLRDSLGMKRIASYYIKTLVMWKVKEINNPQYWKQSSPAVIFTMLVEKFYQALIEGKIPYFWHPTNNLIGNVGRHILNGYVLKLEKVIIVLNEPRSYKLLAKYLLNPQEFEEYRAILHI